VNQILKYEVEYNTVELPLDAEVVHFEALDLDIFYIWCKFNPSEERTEWRYFEVYTESTFEGRYIASADCDLYEVVHLVETTGD
jgi:hypothetical protein